MSPRWLALALLVAAAPGYAQDDLPAERWTLVQCGGLLDVPGKPAKGATSLLVKNGKIAELRDGVAEFGAPPPGVALDVIDRKSGFCLPGLIDLHVHLTLEFNADSRLRRVTESEADVALRGALFAKRTLEAGFTTVRDLGGGEAIFALRDAVAAGTVPGPRLLVAGRPLAITGGHGDLTNGYADGIFDVPGPYEGVADGPYEARKAVRAQVKRGADWIKLTATGGVLSNVASGTDQQFLDDELAAIVQTAHGLGRKVAAHAHGAAGLNAALRAGVDTIEHGTFLDDESLRLFKEKGAWYVPTLTAGRTVAERAKIRGFYPPAVAEKAARVGPQIDAALRRAIAGGAKIAFGTDAGVFAHGENARELGYMVEDGMSPASALLAATVSAAQVLELSHEIGTLEPGKSADLVAVEGNPLEDVTLLESPTLVMRAGIVYKTAK